MDMSGRMLSHCPGQELSLPTLFEEDQLPWNGPDYLEVTILLGLKRPWSILSSKFAQQQEPGIKNVTLNR